MLMTIQLPDDEVEQCRDVEIALPESRIEWLYLR
jgi:hypothetical protein